MSAIKIHVSLKTVFEKPNISTYLYKKLTYAFSFYSIKYKVLRYALLDENLFT